MKIRFPISLHLIYICFGSFWAVFVDLNHFIFNLVKKPKRLVRNNPKRLYGWENLPFSSIFWPFWGGGGRVDKVWLLLINADFWLLLIKMEGSGTPIFMLTSFVTSPYFLPTLYWFPVDVRSLQEFLAFKTNHNLISDGRQTRVEIRFLVESKFYFTLTLYGAVYLSLENMQYFEYASNHKN